MKKVFVAGVMMLPLVGLFAAQASADPGHPKKVTICHAAGLDGTTHYVTLTIGWHAAYGQAGHFLEPGTPAAGHEDDYEGACIVDPEEPIEVTASVTFVDPTCKNPEASAITGSEEGVVYNIQGDIAPGSTVSITATAEEGYVLVGQTTFEHTFGEAPEDCEPTPPPDDDGSWEPSWVPDDGPATPDLSQDLAVTGAALDALPYGIVALITGLGLVGAARWAGKRHN